MSLLLLLFSAVGNPDYEPIAQELAQDCTQDDGDEDEPIEGHNQQHYNVRYAKCNAVEDGAHELLQCSRAENRLLNTKGRCQTIAAVGGSGCQCGLLCIELALKLAENKGIVFVTNAAEELETHDQESRTDAADGHGAITGNMPRGREEARVVDTPIPKHLGDVSICSLLLQFRVSEMFMTYFCDAGGVPAHTGHIMRLHHDESCAACMYNLARWCWGLIYRQGTAGRRIADCKIGRNTEDGQKDPTAVSDGCLRRR
jgi:hypothetical protein